MYEMGLTLDTNMLDTWRTAIAEDAGDCWPVAADYLQEQGMEDTQMYRLLMHLHNLCSQTA